MNTRLQVVDANFAQGMDFDNEAGVLYASPALHPAIRQFPDLTIQQSLYQCTGRLF